QAPVLRLPLVVRRHADAGLPTDVLDGHSSVGLLEDRDDLGLGETGLLHGTSWLGKTCQKVLLMGCLPIGEAYVGNLGRSADRATDTNRQARAGPEDSAATGTGEPPPTRQAKDGQRSAGPRSEERRVGTEGR